MTSGSIGLSGVALNTAFPFHMVVDRALCVQQVGRTLPKVWPNLVKGIGLAELVRFERPNEPLSWEMLVSHGGTLFILACKGTELLLRGQVIIEGERAIFLVSPWLTEVSQLKEYRLSFKDFAIHDPILDLLQILQSQRVSVEDLKQLTATLTKQRAELREVNEQLQGQNVMLSAAQSALAMQEQESRKLALIVAKAENAVVLTDGHGRVEWVNESYTKTTGYTMEEMMGKTPGSVLQGPGSDPVVVEQLRAAIRDRKSFSCEILNYRKDGRKYWVSIDLQPMFSVSGELTNFVAIESDVTLRRAAAARLALQLGVSTILAKSVSQEETIPEILNELLLRLGWRFSSFWRVDAAGEFIGCEHMTKAADERMSDFTSMTSSTRFTQDRGLPGRVWKTGRAHWVPDVTQDGNFPRAGVALIGGMRGALAFPVRAGGSVIGVIECFSADVEPVDSELLKVLESVGGQLGQFIERGRAATALRAAQTRLRTLVEQLPAVTYIAEAGASGRWYYVSPQIQNLLGYTPAEWTANPSLYLDSLHPEDRERVLAEETNAADTRRHYSQVYRFIARDGRTVWCNDLATPVVDEVSGQTVLQGVVFDITESQNAQVVLSQRSEELSIANASLAKASRLKDEFLASMSHELRTPLNAVLGLSEALQENVFGALNEKQAKALKNIEESGRHLLELINDILDLSKIEAGHLILETSDIELEPVCQASIRLIRETATRKRLRISTSFDAEQVVLRADERRLKQILVNLLSNAVKFTPEGGRVGVEVTTNPDANTVSIVVWDTGIGIAKANLERLFKPFVQLDSSLSRQYSGTGLGLSLVRRMAELMHGTVSVESEINKGSHFTVTLPLSVGKKQAVPAVVAAPETERVSSALVIEDSVEAAEILERYLGELGTKVVTDLSGENALEMAVANGVEMIFLDLHLPNQSGWEIMERLRNDPRTAGIPIVIVSVEDPPKSEAPEYADYIVKPVRRERLLKAIQKASPKEVPGKALVVSRAARKKKVLLAEDNETNVLTLTDYLQSKGYDLVFARNGAEALIAAEAHRPDLILMDIQMPVMNGMEAMEALKRDVNLSKIPVIALTSLAMPGDREKCLAAGARAYISKPVSLRSLAQTMETILAAQ